MLLYVDAKGCYIQPSDWRRWPSTSGHPSRRWVRTRFRGGTSSHNDTHELIHNPNDIGEKKEENIKTRKLDLGMGMKNAFAKGSTSKNGVDILTFVVKNEQDTLLPFIFHIPSYYLFLECRIQSFR